MRKIQTEFIKSIRYLCIIGIFAIGMITIVGSGGGGGGGSTSNDEIQDDTNGDTPSPTIGFDFTCVEGDYWEYFWISESKCSSQSGGCGHEVDAGRFRVTLGSPTEINGIRAFPINVTGDTTDGTVDFSPEWTHIALADNSLMGSTDGANLEIICGAENTTWKNGGFFISFPFDEPITGSSSTFIGEYNELSAVEVGISQSSGGCTYYPSIGETICDDESIDISESEYYQYGIGPLGYIFHRSVSYSGGGFYSVHTDDRSVELVDTSLVLPEGITVNRPPWREVADLITPRYALACVVYNGKIYAIGGRDENNTALSSIEVYDPVTDTWSFEANAPTTLSSPLAEVSSDAIYIIPSTGDIQVYYPQTKTWGDGQSAPYSDPSVDSTVVPSGEIIVIESTFNVHIYQPSSDEWFNGFPLSYTDTRWFSVASIGYDIYVIDGYRQYMLGDKIWKGFHRYDALTGDWEEDIGWLNVRRYMTRSVNLNDKIVTIGGYDGSGQVRDVEIYDPLTNTWEQLPKMFRPRQDFDAVVLNGEIYVIGGSSGGSVWKSVEVYTP